VTIGASAPPADALFPTIEDGVHGTAFIEAAVRSSALGNILNLTSIVGVYLNAAVQGFVIIVVAFLQRGRR
jgi:hypothetical protein